MKGCSFVPLVVLLLFVSGTLCGSVTPRFLVLAETPAIATNLVSAISATLTALGSVTSHDDTTYNTGDPTCYLCSAISTSYAGVIWQLGTNIETLSSYATIKQNIQDFVNTGRVVILTGTSIFATQEPNGNLLNTVGAKDYFPHINPATGNGGQLTDYAICDPMLKGFFGDIRLRTPASFGTTIFNQAEVETLVPGAGLASCWEVTYSDLAVGGRFTVRQLTNGGILSYMQCDAANSMSEFTQSFYNIGYNNLLDYSLGLENGTIRIATTPATNRIAIVSTMPVDQLASPATGLYPVKYVPLLDFFGGESPSSSFMGSPISILTYKAVVIVLHNSGYSSDPNWSTYANNLQNFADSGGLVLVYGATPQLSTDTGFVTLLGGASTVADTSGISNVGFGNFATCSKILNGPFGSYVSLNPRTADSTFTGQFDGVTVDTISGGTAVPCLSTFGGNGVITYQNALNNGLFVYIASPTINDPSENFQYITESYYRDIYNNLLANFLGLSGGAGGDPHIFLFGGEEIELNFESGKSYKFYGSHEFSVGITTVGYLNTIFIANVGVTMGTHHLMATSSLTHPVFKYNGETLPVGSIVHTPIGEAEVFIPEPRHVRGALSEMQEYLTIGIRIGDHLEIVGGVYKPFIFFNIEITRNSASNEFGLLHSAHAFNQRSVDFVQQFETDSVFF